MWMPIIQRAIRRSPPPRLVLIARHFSSKAAGSNASSSAKKIAIHFGTSTGTAQLFAQELQMALQEQCNDNSHEITVTSLADTPTVHHLDPLVDVHLFVVSTAGVGEPPGPAKAFFASLPTSTTTDDKDTPLKNIRYSVFGLGNSVAHPHHYNLAGRALDQGLQAAHATPWLPLALGDDGDCIENDFDVWQDAVLKKLQEEQQNGSNTSASEGKEDHDEHVSTAVASEKKDNAGIKKPSSLSSKDRAPPPPPAFGQRLELVPTPPDPQELTRTDLLDLVAPTTFYHKDTHRWKVHRHVSLNPQPTANGLHELELVLDTDTDSVTPLSYEAGDHLVVYPSQPDYLVEAYLDHWDISVAQAMHSVVVQKEDEATTKSTYPHPTGISLYDTLRYCVDLLAPPSPKLARLLLWADELQDYKHQIFAPRLSPLAVLLQQQPDSNPNISLEDLLYHLPPLAPRYYSIASSPAKHPDSVVVTYRPVRYVNPILGVSQQGLCTQYLQHLQAETNHTLVAYINSNPSFRLPTNAETPIILVAGGCGVAAVRGLVEELACRNSSNNQNTRTPVYIFLGFRNPADAAYLDVMQSIEPKLLDVSYSVSSCTIPEQPCEMVSERLVAHADLLRDLLLHQGACLYACGGARTFGASLQSALSQVLGSPQALQELVDQGRYREDLAD